MLDDSAFLDRLLELTRAPEAASLAPVGGLNDEWRVECLRLVPSDDGFDDLGVEVTWRQGSTWRPNGSARLLFDRQWRIDSGLATPESFLGRVLSAASDAEGSAPSALTSPGDPERAWARLVEVLERDSKVTEVDGGLLVERLEGDVAHVHLTREEWAEHFYRQTRSLVSTALTQPPPRSGCDRRTRHTSCCSGTVSSRPSVLSFRRSGPPDPMATAGSPMPRNDLASLTVTF